MGSLAFLLFSSFSFSDPTTLGAVDCLKQHKKLCLKYAKVTSQKELQQKCSIVLRGYKLYSHNQSVTSNVEKQTDSLFQ